MDKETIMSLTHNCKSDNIKERLYWIENGMSNYPSCKTCGALVTKFRKQNYPNSNRRYALYCSFSCRANDLYVTEKMLNTHKNKWIVLMSKLNTLSELKTFFNDNYFTPDPRKNGIKLNGNITRVLTDNVKRIIDDAVSINLISDDYVEKIYWVLNDINSYPVKCKECGDDVKFFKGFGYKTREFCSNACRAINKDRIDNMINNTDYIKKAIDTKHSVMEKYGVANVMHNTDIFDKCMHNQYKWKEYILPSGNIIKLQGYENRALDELLNIYNESDIVFTRKLIPTFYYELEGNTKKYYPDFYIPKDNLIIEVKSEYTLHSNKEMNSKKFSTVKEKGYNLKVMVYQEKSFVARIL